jgi:hypothetical protein
MSRRTSAEDEWDDDEDDLGYEAEDDEVATTPCPYCRREVHEDSQRCPYCGNYISAEDAPASRKTPWFVMGFLLCLSIVFLWILRGL